MRGGGAPGGVLECARGQPRPPPPAVPSHTSLSACLPAAPLLTSAAKAEEEARSASMDADMGKSDLEACDSTLAACRAAQEGADDKLAAVTKHAGNCTRERCPRMPCAIEVPQRVPPFPRLPPPPGAPQRAQHAAARSFPPAAPPHHHHHHHHHHPSCLPRRVPGDPGQPDGHAEHSQQDQC